MSVEQDIFLIGVTGSRKNVVRMLNAALKSFNSDNVIADSDDVATIYA